MLLCSSYILIFSSLGLFLFYSSISTGFPHKISFSQNYLALFSWFARNCSQFEMLDRSCSSSSELQCLTQPGHFQLFKLIFIYTGQVVMLFFHTINIFLFIACEQQQYLLFFSSDDTVKNLFKPSDWKHHKLFKIMNFIPAKSSF